MNRPSMRTRAHKLHPLGRPPSTMPGPLSLSVESRSGCQLPTAPFFHVRIPTSLIPPLGAGSAQTRVAETG